MRHVRWESDHGSERVDDYAFFSRPLEEPVAFQFWTRRMEVAPHVGAWSLKFVLAGRETYRFGNRRLTLSPGDMLLVERGRTYGSDIGEATESLSLFLPDEWVRDAAAGLDGWDKRCDGAERLSLPVVPARLAGPGRAALQQLGGCLAHDAARAAECALVLLAEALAQAEVIQRQSDRLATKRPAIRDELLTRLRRAHDQIVDHAGLDMDLDLMSRTACLSRFHFLRLFRQVYGTTPARFAAGVRMQKAARLAERGDVTAALAAGGFRSEAAFRRASKRRGQ